MVMKCWLADLKWTACLEFLWLLTLLQIIVWNLPGGLELRFSRQKFDEWSLKFGNDMAKYVVNQRPVKKGKNFSILRQFQFEVAPHSNRQQQLACLVLLLSSTSLWPITVNSPEKGFYGSEWQKNTTHDSINIFLETLFQQKGKTRL